MLCFILCVDIENLCPDAWLINLTNPESRICLAICKYTKVKVVGICHQIAYGITMLSKLLDIPAENLDVKAAGLNHFTWFLDIRDKKTGEDLYPKLRCVEGNFDPSFEPMTRMLLHRFGLFPTAGDEHLGEYLAYAHEYHHTRGFDFDKFMLHRQHFKKHIEDIADGIIPVDDETRKPSGEITFRIVKGVWCNTNEYLLSSNLPNKGYITNLSREGIVEVPAVASGFGVNGIGVGDLPRPIAALCNTQIEIQQLVVDAGVKGDPKLARQALLMDPNVTSAKAAEAMFDEMMETFYEYLPQFK